MIYRERSILHAIVLNLSERISSFLSFSFLSISQSSKIDKVKLNGSIHSGEIERKGFNIRWSFSIICYTSKSFFHQRSRTFSAFLFFFLHFCYTFSTFSFFLLNPMSNTLGCVALQSTRFLNAISQCSKGLKCVA